MSKLIDRAISLLLDELMEYGPPGTPEPVVKWLRSQGIDPDELREASVDVSPIPDSAWTEGFVLGWVAHRERERE